MPGRLMNPLLVILAIATIVSSGCSRFVSPDLRDAIRLQPRRDWQDVDLEKELDLPTRSRRETVPETDATSEMAEFDSSVVDIAERDTAEVQQNRYEMARQIQKRIPEFRLPPAETVKHPLRPLTSENPRSTEQKVIHLRAIDSDKTPEIAETLSGANSSGSTSLESAQNPLDETGKAATELGLQPRSGLRPIGGLVSRSTPLSPIDQGGESGSKAPGESAVVQVGMEASAAVDAGTDDPALPKEVASSSGGDFQPVGTAVVAADSNDFAASPAAQRSKSSELLGESKPNPSLDIESTEPTEVSVSTRTEPIEAIPAPAPWDAQLAATIQAFEDQVIALDDDDYRRAPMQRSLALLMALESHLSESQMALDSPEQRKYWQHQVAAILNLLQDSAASEEVRLGKAIDHLQQAVDELQQLSNLKIATVEFCRQVNGYGQYRTMSELHSGRPTLVYCEIENFRSLRGTVQDEEVYLTRLKCRIEIETADGQSVHQQEFPVIEDVARNRRRDFYLHLPLTFPDLAAGDYLLKLTVEDLGSGKIARLESGYPFEIE